MLRCRELVQRSSDYLDGELKGPGKFWFRLHLFMCVNCRRYLRHLRVSIATTARLGRRPTPLAEAEQIARRCNHPD